MTINISELEALRAKMTGGDWELDEDSNDQLNIYARNQDTATDWIALLPHQCLKSIEEQQQHNADGLLAEHNAIPALLALARAVVEFEAAKRDAKGAHDEWARAMMGMHHPTPSPLHDPRYAAIGRAEFRLSECQAAYDAARAAVTL